MLIAAMVAATAPIDEAKKLFNEGNYQAALEILKPLAAKSPRDGSINYWYGATLNALGRDAEAIAPLEKAEGRGIADASLLLARIATAQYRPDDARDYYDTYETQMRKNRKQVPESVEQDMSRLVLMENMLSRVEKIAVIDSFVVDADRFFEHYRLSPEAGRLVDGATARVPDAELVFVPQNNTEILYARPDSLGNFTLMGAGILDDGSVDHPAPLPGDDLAGGGNAEYPFLMSDGLTLYYANDGEGSIGGYDIFLTRRADDGYLQPQNVGMPYNSPYDDYLLAIDETTGAGWWATDRNRIPGKVTIYVFVPSETRVNVGEDDPNLVALASLSDIALTREPGKDYNDILARIQRLNLGNNTTNAAISLGGSFEIPIGSNKRIYRSVSDFEAPAAREAMMQAIDARAEIANIEERLAKLRDAYRHGDHSQNITILNLEHQLDDARTRLNDSVNDAIRAELTNQ